MTDDPNPNPNPSVLPEGDELEKEIAEALGDLSVMDMVDAPRTPTVASTAPSVLNAAGQGGEHQMVKGVIVAVHDDDVFVDVGGKSQGIVPLSQFKEPPELGSEMEFVVEGVLGDEGLVKLSREGAVAKATWQSLERGMIVEAHVTGSNTGGLELKLAGQRAFMPASQIDIQRVDNLNQFLNQKLKCQVIELDRRGKKIVLSRRAVMQAERESMRAEAMEKIKAGDMVTGTVRSIQQYGAFVDIGGVDGLIHISDLSYQRVGKVEQVVKVDDKVQVKVLSIDAESGRIALSLKDAMPNPWDGIESRYAAGSAVTGEVVKLTKFGAFVEIEPGVEGLIPMGEMSWGRVQSAGEVLKKGDRITAKLMSVDPGRQRLSLSLKQMGDDPWAGVEAAYPPDTEVEGKVTRTTDFGAFVELQPGVEGMVHISEMSHKRVNTVEDVVKAGETVKAMVLAVDGAKRRVSLSIKALTEAPAGQQRRGGDDRPRRQPKISRQEIRKYEVKDTKKASTGESLGALLDKFSGPEDGLKGGIG